ncbi:hypothetical protein Tco_1199687 [Tanacetum coccineum]
MASHVEQLAQHIDREIARDLKVCKMLLEISQELYVRETHESMPETVVNEPTVVSQPKVWTDASIIEEYKSDSDDEHVSLPSKEQEIPSKGNVQRKNKPVWNNVQRVNHKNQFVPTPVLTRTGKIPVNTARASVLLGGNGKLLLSPQQVVVGDPKDMVGTKSPNTMDVSHKALENKGIVDSGCSRHMTGNKAYLAEYQDYNGGPVAFGGSKGYITGKDLGQEKQGSLHRH